MRVEIVEVGPRDGLQNEPEHLAPEVRAELVRRLATTGLARIEVGSFVNPTRVPQMAGIEDVVAGSDIPDVTRSALVLNARGYERLRDHPVPEAHLPLVRAMRERWVIGTPSTAADRLRALAAEFDVDEVMVHPVAGAFRESAADAAPAREATLELLAKELLG